MDPEGNGSRSIKWKRERRGEYGCRYLNPLLLQPYPSGVLHNLPHVTKVEVEGKSGPFAEREEP